MTYKQHLAPLIEKCSDGHPRQSDIADLALSMGCLTCVIERGSWRLLDPSQPPPNNEYVIVSALLLLMRLPDVASCKDCNTAFSVLDGLSKKQRWLACLENTDDAFSLAMMLIFTISKRRDANLIDAILQQRNSIEAGALALINAWTKPKSEFLESSSVEQLARLLFGDPWCDLALGGESLSAYETFKLILGNRPPLLPKLLPLHLHPEVQTLPPMGLSYCGE